MEQESIKTNPLINQFKQYYKTMSLQKKIIIFSIITVLIISIVTFFYITNKPKFSLLFSDLSKKDSETIVTLLKSKNIPYQEKKNNKKVILYVPDEEVYKARLAVTEVGLPKDGTIGYEIFDKTEFGTTNFVQQINYQRALQGELIRTIKSFDEVIGAKVLIVMPKDSVFIEETKPPSASVLLKLVADLKEEQIQSIVYLVANSIESLMPEAITIVDTTGRTLYKKMTEDEELRLKDKDLIVTQVKYKNNFESSLAKRIQTMLERIVGLNKAIVRVTSEMDLNQVKTDEEIFDPEERSTPFVRSRKSVNESSELKTGPVGTISSVNPIVPPGGFGVGKEAIDSGIKNNDIVNYELSKIVRKTKKPMAVLKRLSVSAVIDGKYIYEETKTGKKIKKYIVRTKSEMEKFRDVVKKAMGFNEDRGDQVSVESFPFASIDILDKEIETTVTFKTIIKDHSKSIINFILVLILIMFIIRPIVNTVKEIKSTIEVPPINLNDDRGVLKPIDVSLDDFLSMSQLEQSDFFDNLTKSERLSYLLKMDVKEKIMFFEQLPALKREMYLNEFPVKEKAIYYAHLDIEKTVNVLKGWLRETEEKIKKEQQGNLGF